MAARLAQAPLPWLPEGAEEVAPGSACAAAGRRRRGVGARAGDVLLGGRGPGGPRLAAVQLTELKAATQQQVAGAFGTNPVTVWRWADATGGTGWPGCCPCGGAEGPVEADAEAAARIRELGGEGKSQAAIAAECGVSTFAVRAALGRVPARPAAAATPAGGEGGRRSRRPGAGLGAGHAAGAADPVPREAERALARFGLLGEGAAPVSPRARGTRWPGCCWRCPPWPAPGWPRRPAACTGGSDGSTAWR